MSDASDCRVDLLILYASQVFIRYLYFDILCLCLRVHSTHPSAHHQLQAEECRSHANPESDLQGAKHR